jgi:hypothetical protein
MEEARLPRECGGTLEFAVVAQDDSACPFVVTLTRQ